MTRSRNYRWQIIEVHRDGQRRQFNSYPTRREAARIAARMNEKAARVSDLHYEIRDAKEAQ